MDMAQITPMLPILVQHSRPLSREFLRMLLLVPALFAASVLLLVDRRHPIMPTGASGDLHEDLEGEFGVAVPVIDRVSALRPADLELVSAQHSESRDRGAALHAGFSRAAGQYLGKVDPDSDPTRGWHHPHRAEAILDVTTPQPMMMQAA